MQIHLFDDPGSYYDRARSLLLAQEDRYSVLIGVAIRCRDGEAFGEEPPWMAVIEDAGRPRMAALQTPPHPLTLTDASGEELDLVVQCLLDSERTLPGVVGPDSAARGFAERWSQAVGVECELHMRQRLHRLDRVLVPGDAAGGMRPALPGDLPLACKWVHRFAIECRLPEAQDPEPPERVLAIDEGRLFLWENPEPVCMAAWTRPTPKGVSISAVYTPEAQRGRGYASSLVAALSQKMLDEGKDFCCLATDLANPTSNKIYARIGYRPVVDFPYYVFSSR
jgi:GNAT superfamily N-acetyltransferase